MLNPVNILWRTTGYTDPLTINHSVSLIELTFDDCGAGLVICDDDDDEDQEVSAAECDFNEMSSRPAGRQLNGHVLSTVDCVAYLSSDDYEPLFDNVPTTIKENVMFTVEMHSAPVASKFWDDCGTWVRSHSKEPYHLLDEMNELSVNKDGQHGLWKRINGKVVVCIDPQAINVVVLHRLYSKLRRHDTITDA